MRCRRVAALLLALLAAAGSEAARAAGGYQLEKIALDGEAAPGAGGATYQSVDLYGIDLDATGQVAFGATLSGSAPAWGVFAETGGSVEARAISGDAAPLPLGGTYVAFGYPSFDDAGDLTFGAIVRVSPTESANALLRAGAGGDAILVSELDAAPGTGGTLAVSVGDTSLHGHGPGGAPVFRSAVVGGSASSGVFVGTTSAVALSGSASPAGGTFAGFGYPSANASGQVVFDATLSGAPASSGLFLDAGSGPATLLLAGDLDPGGETFRSFAVPRMNAGGDVLFLAEWEPDGSSGGIYVIDAEGLRSLVRSGDVLPETGGASLATLGGVAHLSDAGTVAFSASLTGGSVPAAVFVADADGALQLVAQSGDPVPGAPGAHFASFGVAASNGAGEVAFAATTDGGANGVFLAAPLPPAVPAIPGSGAAVLVALLVFLDGVSRGRSRRSVHA